MTRRGFLGVVSLAAGAVATGVASLRERWTLRRGDGSTGCLEHSGRRTDWIPPPCDICGAMSTHITNQLFNSTRPEDKWEQYTPTGTKFRRCDLHPVPLSVAVLES